MIKRARALVEETGLTYPAIAVAIGVHVRAVYVWQTRGRWVRPAEWNPSRATPANRERYRAERFRSRGGQRYVPDVVARVRALVEGTGLTLHAIEARTGVCWATVFKWQHDRGWVRPASASRWCRLVASDRAPGFRARLAAAFSRLADLADAEVARSSSPRPDRPALQAARRLAKAARRGARQHGPPAEPGRVPAVMRHDGPVRLSVRELGPRHLPRRDDVVAAARQMVEGTRLTQRQIARHLGVQPDTIGTWRQDGGWIRPDGAPSRYGGQEVGGRFRERMADRIEARRMLDDVEAALSAAEADGGGLGPLQTAYAGLVRARERVGSR